MALRTITGIGAAPGIGQGRAMIAGASGSTPAQTAVLSPADALAVAARPAELERFRQAFRAAAAQLEQLAAQVRTQLGAGEAAMFEAQELFLHDPALIAPVETAIKTWGHPVPFAVEQAFEAAVADLEALPEPYLRSRAADLRDVKRRVVGLLTESSTGHAHAIDGDTVVIARDLPPSETVDLATAGVRGIVLADGAPGAHTAILARSLGLPLVVGAGTAIWAITPGQPVIVDGSDGMVLVDPDASERDVYRVRHARWQDARRAQPAVKAHPTGTLDGRPVAVTANVSSAAEARLARAKGAAGIGLLRTEFMLAALVGQRAAPPDEEEMTDAYGTILQVMDGFPISVRALDAGGDKPLPFIHGEHEANPVLGWRGIRILLDQPALFTGQIRALLRAAARHGTTLRLLLPMISSLDEFVRARRLVEAVSLEEAVALAHPLQIGAMIEVPGAALIADALASEADFLSLGTNDLVQYTLACDRGNARVSHIYQFLHPGVVRLVDLVVRAAHAQGRRVSVCGEVASDAAAIPLLVGLGVDELSVRADQIADVHECVAALEYRHLQSVAAEALRLTTAQRITDLLMAQTSRSR